MDKLCIPLATVLAGKVETSGATRKICARSSGLEAISETVRRRAISSPVVWPNLADCPSPQIIWTIANSSASAINPAPSKLENAFRFTNSNCALSRTLWSGQPRRSKSFDWFNAAKSSPIKLSVCSRKGCFWESLTSIFHIAPV